jgi:hypothetical protein
MSVYMIANFYSFGKFVPVFAQCYLQALPFCTILSSGNGKHIHLYFSVLSMELSYVRRSITNMALESRYHMLFACSLLALSVRPEKS